MKKVIYSILFELLNPYLIKTSIREPISPECRLSLTLLYFSQGTSIQSLAWSYKLGKTTVRAIILETCGMIWSCLFPFYVSEPTKANFEDIERDFWTMWNMPNCIGAVDGKHVAINCPPNSGSQFFNYKKFHSIVLMAVVDAKLELMVVKVMEVRYTIRKHKLTNFTKTFIIFYISNFGKRLLNEELDIPSPKSLPSTTEIVPHYLVGDAAFPLHNNLMKPYPGQCLPKKQEIFNARLSRAKRVVENAFGVLVARWRILLTTINMLPENAEKVVLACVALHNFLKMNEESRTTYSPETFVDWEDEENILHEGLWRKEVTNNLASIKASSHQHVFRRQTSLNIRNKLCHFVNEIHKLPGQKEK